MSAWSEQCHKEGCIRALHGGKHCGDEASGYCAIKAELEWRKVRRRFTTARRELRKAVEKFAGVTDPLPGHKIEAVRLARQLRDEAQAAVEALSDPC